MEAHPDSDVNLSLYYRSDRPLTVAKLRRLAPGLEARHLPDLVTKTGERVPWINGGCWLLAAGGGPSRGLALARRGQGCDHNRAGRLRSDGLPLPTGPPHGFHEHFYFGEVNRCRTLHDLEGLLWELKSAASIYSPKLKRPLVAKYLWEAGFSLEIACKPPARGEPPASRVPV